MVKVFIDPGHGGRDSGAIGHGLKESDLCLAISLYLRDMLQNEYEGVQVRMSRTTDVFVSLQDRVNAANRWGADVFVSVHINGFHLESANGYEDYIHTSPFEATVALQNVMHPEIIKEMSNNIRNRGKKRANFFVLRETNMTAILTENLFITNRREADLLRQSSLQMRIARGHANGLEKAYGLKKKPKRKPNDSVYVVKAGDNLTHIARDNNTTVNELVRLNNISDPDRINVGQRIKLPSSSTPSSYTVRAGDTLSGIAARFGTTTSRLVRLNNISNPNVIHPGQRIRLR